MAAQKELSGAGLRGQVAGKTSLSTVGKSGSGLTYRGYDVSELADKCIFEEVAYLLLYGNLPTQSELDAYQAKRVARTARVQLQSRAIGEHIYHPDGAHAQLRNQVMRAHSQDDWFNAIEWLYGSTGLD
mgnify:CR=1 FL=1